MSPITAAPRLQVLVTFGGSTETDITADVRRCSISRGRSKERETMSPGRADITLWNFAGKYDPDNTAGPYYPDIRPNKIVRVLAFVPTAATSSAFTIGSSALGGGDAFGGGAEYEVSLFVGRLEGSTLNYAEGGWQPEVTWRVVDASKRLNRDRSTTGFGIAGELTGARVTAVLDGASPTWPSTERDIAPGTHTVQYAAGDQGRYDYLVQVAASEPGAFFISKRGWAIFRDATYAPTPAVPALGNAPDEYAFSSVEITDEESEIYNAVTVTANALSDQVEQDTSSQVEFGRADLSVSSLLDTTGDMDDLALTYLVAYNGPRRRVSRLKVDRVAADWYWFLSKELMERVTVNHRPVYGGTFQQTSAIQGLQIEVNGSQDWEMTFNLSPPLDIISNPNLLTEDQSSMETSSSGWVYAEGFNTGSGDWYIGGRESGAYAVLIGQYSLEVDKWGGDAISRFKTTPHTTVPVTVGHTYRGSLWIRDTGYMSTYVYPQLLWLNSGGTQIDFDQGYQFGSYISGVNEWAQGTVEGVAPPGAVYVALGFRIHNVGSDGGLAYMDGAELRDTLVISPTSAYPATVQAQTSVPTPQIIATPQSRTVSVSTIAVTGSVKAATAVVTDPFVPTDIAGLKGWYDPSDASTVLNNATGLPVTADGQDSDTLLTKGGTEGDFFANNDDPVWKTAQINGRAVLRFDGVDDGIQNSVPSDSTWTFFIVAKKRGVVSSASDTLFSTASNAAIYTNTLEGAGYIYSEGQSVYSVVLGGTPTNTNIICGVLTSATVMNVRINGGAGTSLDPDNVITTSTSWYVGHVPLSSDFGDYDVGEMVFYGSALSLADINRVGPYLASRWGTTWTTAT